MFLTGRENKTEIETRVIYDCFDMLFYILWLRYIMTTLREKNFKKLRWINTENTRNYIFGLSQEKILIFMILTINFILTKFSLLLFYFIVFKVASTILYGHKILFLFSLGIKHK